MSDNAPVTPTRTGVPAAAAAPGDEPSVGELVAAVQRDLTLLVKQEVELAKSELKVNLRIGGMSVAMFAVAAFLLLLAVIMASVGLAHVISLTGLDLAWSFLLVFLLYTLVAGVLAFVGYRQVRKVRGPQRALHQAQETKEALLHRR